MLKGMSAEGRQEKHEEAVVFARFSQFSESAQAEKNAAIAKAEDAIDRLTADIAEAKQNSADATLIIGEVLQDMGANEAQMQNATDLRQTERSAFEVTLQDYTESVSALESAIQILKKQPANIAQNSIFAQLAGNKLIPTRAKQALDAFLQQAGDVDPDFDVTAPEGYAYEFHSQTVVDLLQKLLEKFVDEKHELETNEANANHAYQLGQADFRATNEQLSASKDFQVNRKAENDATVNKNEEVKRRTEAVLADDTAYVKELSTLQTQKSSEFEARQKLRDEEIEALEKAIAILTTGVQPHDEQWVHKTPTTLVQMRGVRADPALERLTSFLGSEAQRLHSPLLSTLATSAASDPFEKVREMINNLITRLKEEASSEAEHKGWCDTELATNTQTREEKTATVEKLHATVDELEASMEKLAMEVAELSAQVSRLQEEVSNATSIRHEETATNEEAIKDAQDAQSSLTQAIQILTDFYAKAGQAVSLTQQSPSSEAPSTWTEAYNGNQVGGTNVISFLQVIQSDFARLESETTAAESEAVRAFDEFTGKAEVTRAANTQEIEYKTQLRQQQDAKLVDSKADLEDTQKALEAANAYYEKLKPSCVTAGVTAGDRSARRQEEIESLREALRILENETP